jgi:Flp pilus assembly protein TadD
MMLRIMEYEHLEMNRRALEAALRMTQRFPRDHRGFAKLGLGYERIGRLGMARKAYKRALSIQPRTHEARSGLERIADRRAELDSAPTPDAAEDGSE